MDSQLRAPSDKVRCCRKSGYLNAGRRRGEVVAKSQTKLQTFTVQRRASEAFNPILSYPEMQAYFWIQIVHATLLPLHQWRE